MTWKAWWPEKGETEVDAISISYEHFGEVMEYDFENAAEQAGWHAEYHRDGWEVPFDEDVIVMIQAPNGEVRKCYYKRELSVHIWSKIEHESE
jgi:hypothetical protein